jgi:hypothetical protein
MSSVLGRNPENPREFRKNCAEMSELDARFPAESAINQA